MTFLALEKLIHLRDGYRRVVRVNGVELVLLVEGNNTFLVQNACPHMGKSLDRGEVDAHRLSLRCPHHGLEFDLVSGRNINNRGNVCGALRTFRLAYEGNMVGIDVGTM